MQITIDVPDDITQVGALKRKGWLRETAIALFQQKELLIEQSANLISMDVDDFYGLLVDRQILTAPSDPDDTPDELVLAHLRISLQEVAEEKTIPLFRLWDDIKLPTEQTRSHLHPRDIDINKNERGIDTLNEKC
jgi:predicted HTH domain antitoxin